MAGGVTRDGTWVGYEGDARAVLAVVLLAAALLAITTGARVERPRGIPRPRRRGVGAALVAGWVAALIAFVAGFTAYAAQTVRDHPQGTRPPEPVLPFTLAFAVLTAVVIAANTRGPRRDRVLNAAIGALVAPMIFELPFDLIVMTRTYPPVAPHPGLYRAMFFGPLVLVELTTMALLVLAPAAVVSRAGVVTVGAMLLVFAGWALVGFGFPSTSATLAFNVAAKFLAFVAAIGLFLPHWPHATVARLRRLAGTVRTS